LLVWCHGGSDCGHRWSPERRQILALSIVDPTAGVTRDRVSSIVRAGDRYFDLMDTGGIGIEDRDNLTEDVERQIQIAIDQADVVLFVVDARSGMVPLDETVADRLRVVNKPIILVVNKCDNPDFDLHASDFHRLGYQPVVTVSAEQRRGKEQLFNEILARVSVGEDQLPPVHPTLEIAIVGRRNVGKSTFINSLAQAERVIVSEVAGTTRDSIDVRFERDGKTFVAIDTAGVRNKSSIADDIEFYSMARAERSIRRAGVVLHFFDSRLRISKVDKQLTEYVLQHHKPAIFVMNKWDLLKEKVSIEAFGEYVRKVFPMLDFVPIVFITAKSGKNVYKLLNLAQHLAKQSNKRVGTGELNRVLELAIKQQPPPSRMNRHPKILYATQVGVAPPHIVLFTNGPELFDESYRRYLMKHFRDHLPYSEVPIHLELRNRHSPNRPNFEEAETVVESKPVEVEEIIEEAKPKPTKRKKENTGGLWNL
jgi:GTP-binding protein